MIELLAALFVILAGVVGIIFAPFLNRQHDRFWSKYTSKNEDDMKQFRSSTPVVRAACGVFIVIALFFMLTNIDG